MMASMNTNWANVQVVPDNRPQHWKDAYPRDPLAEALEEWAHRQLGRCPTAGDTASMGNAAYHRLRCRYCGWEMDA